MVMVLVTSSECYFIASPAVLWQCSKCW